MIIIEAKSIELLNRLLKLPASGFEQDWEIELSNSKRIDEFVELYQKCSDLSEADRKALMALIISSCDDALNNGSFDEVLWQKIVLIITDEKELHRDLVTYWTSGKNTDDSFMISCYLSKLY